jgi:hypothetical protein
MRSSTTGVLFMTRLLTVALVVLAWASAIHAEQKAPTNPDAALLSDFKDRIDKYVELRNKADNSAAPLKKTPEPADIRAAQNALTERVGAARTGAKHGDIFTPEITAHFRRLLHPQLKDKGNKQLIKDDNPGNFPFKVNAPYPEKQPLSTVPPEVLASLPQLPKDIEYRFVGNHLILRDARANLIIDYIPNAIS